jgi:hypothetical protein
MTQSNYSVHIKFKYLSLMLSFLGLFPCLAWGVEAVGSFPVTATVLQPLTITSTSTLSFGSFVAGAGGSVTIPSAAPHTRTSTSNVTLVSSNAGSVSNITVSGVAGTTYTVILPVVPTTLSSATGGATMQISTISSNLTGLAGLIPTLGSQTFQVGGTLVVASNQLPGVYSGTLPITITYN